MHGFSVQRDAIGIVHESIEDGIGVGRFADDRVPMLDGQLAVIMWNQESSSGDVSGGRGCAQSSTGVWPEGVG